jgi:hypothetical protein
MSNQNQLETNCGSQLPCEVRVADADRNLNSQPLLTNGTKENTYLWHNVSHVVRGAKTEIVRKIDAHYAQRGGHFPTDASQLYILVNSTGEIPEALVEQVEYLSNLYHKPVRIVRLSELNGANGDVYPYIRVPETDQAIAKVSPELKVWGFHPSVTGELKKKGKCKQRAFDLGIQTPDFILSRVGRIVVDGDAFGNRVEKDYEDKGVPGYPVAEIIKAFESDGAYTQYGIRTVRNGFLCLPDGKNTDNIVVKSRLGALELAEEHLKKTVNIDYDDRVVIERYIDGEDSPGLIFAISQGEVMFIGVNDQVRNGSACVGTSTYVPSTERAEWYIERDTPYLIESFTALVRRSCEDVGVPIQTITAMGNLDTVTPGHYEESYLKARGIKPRVNKIEVNPRFTNLTDGVLQVLQLSGHAVTPDNIRSVLRNGFLALDEVLNPPQVSRQEFRDIVSGLDQRYQQSGTRIIARMVQHPHAGVIFSGPEINNARAELENVLLKR